MDGCVPEETQRRWAEKVAQVKFLEPELARRQQLALEAAQNVARERKRAAEPYPLAGADPG